MRILYLSCHSILEYDELSILERLGIEYFSLGSYIQPQSPVDPIRPPLTRRVDQDLLRQAPDRLAIPKSFIDNFDTIIVMHVPEWIEVNWENMKHKRVIWRTIGQSTPAIELRMQRFVQEGMQIVRYSPRESNLANYAGESKVIRFTKDPAEFNGYTGTSSKAICISQNMKHRGEFCNYATFEKIAQGLDVKLYGTSNESSGDLSGGFLTYEAMKDLIRTSRAFIYTGTQPACYTLSFIEAMMTGIPVVAIGPKLANSLNISGDMYEIADMIENGYNGYISDDVQYLRERIQTLAVNPTLAKTIGERGRQKAISLFGIEPITEQWRQFLTQNVSHK